MTRWQVLEAHYNSATDAACAALQELPAGYGVVLLDQLEGASDQDTSAEADQVRQAWARVDCWLVRRETAWRHQACQLELRHRCDLLRTTAELERQGACAEADQEPAQVRPGCRRAAPPPPLLMAGLLASSVQRNAPNHRACSQIRSRRAPT